jgi:hypothetical protein
VVVQAGDVWGVVYKVEEVIQVWVGRSGVFGGVVVRAEEMLREIIQVGVGRGWRETGFVSTPPPR